jgi:hypothetical protein
VGPERLDWEDSDESDAPIAAAVGEWSPTTEIVLLAYLAVRPGVRSTGLGGELLSNVTALWRTRWKPVAILAEIEHPLAHSATEAYGDPVKRLRFYARHGLRALDIPYFQPSLKRGFGRVFGILLTVVWLSDEGVGAEPDTADGERIRRYLVEYLTATEGRAGPTRQPWRYSQRLTGQVVYRSFHSTIHPCCHSPGLRLPANDAATPPKLTDRCSGGPRS